LTTRLPFSKLHFAKSNNLVVACLPPKQKIKEFCRIHGITFLALFGSYARGDNNKDSDMDFLVKINSGKSLIDVIRVENKMADLFDKKVQFVEEDTVPLELKKTINKEKIVLYEER